MDEEVAITLLGVTANEGKNATALSIFSILMTTLKRCCFDSEQNKTKQTEFHDSIGLNDIFFIARKFIMGVVITLSLKSIAF